MHALLQGTSEAAANSGCVACRGVCCAAAHKSNLRNAIRAFSEWFWHCRHLPRHCRHLSRSSLCAAMSRSRSRNSDGGTRDVLLCLHELRLDSTRHGHPLEFLDACVAKHSGGEATWRVNGGFWLCRPPRASTIQGPRAAGHTRRLQQHAPASDLLAHVAKQANPDGGTLSEV